MIDDEQEFRERAMTLARSGLFQSFVQIGAELESQGVTDAIARIGRSKRFKLRLNAICNETRPASPQ
jgi:hypothetical protein